MAEINGVLGPWSSIDVAIEGEPLAKNGLRKRRHELEEIVAPYVTTQKTNDEITFKGKRRYLTKPLFGGGEKRLHAILALQHLYNIEAAWKAGDIDKVVRASVGYATSDADRRLIEWAGVSGVEAAAFRARTKRTRVETRKGRRELRSLSDLILQSAFATHRRKRNWLKCITDDVIRHRGGEVINPKTVRTELRIRGILE